MESSQNTKFFNSDVSHVMDKRFEKSAEIQERATKSEESVKTGKEKPERLDRMEEENPQKLNEKGQNLTESKTCEKLDKLDTKNSEKLLRREETEIPPKLDKLEEGNAEESVDSADAKHGYFTVFYDDISSEESSDNDDDDDDEDEDSDEKDQDQDQLFTPGYVPVTARQLPPNVTSEASLLAKKWMKPLDLNIAGLKHYEEDKDEEALELFKQAAEVDSANVNGLKHCRYLLRRLGRKLEADEIRQKLEDILKGDDAHIIKTRSEAELLIALKTNIRLIVDTDLKRVIIAAGNEIEPGELAFWNLNLAETLHWRYLNYERMGHAGGLEKLQECIELHCQIATSQQSDAPMKALSLNKLGNLLFRPRDVNAQPIIKEAVQKYQVLWGSLNPLDYFARAFALDKSSPFVCSNYALYLMRNKKLQEAEAMVNKTFTVLDPDLKYYEPYSIRAELNLKLYKRDEKKERLETAIKDSTLMTKSAVSAHVFGLLGNAHHLLLLHDNPFYVDPSEMRPALRAFDSALDLMGYRYVFLDIYFF